MTIYSAVSIDGTVSIHSAVPVDSTVPSNSAVSIDGTVFIYGTSFNKEELEQVFPLKGCRSSHTYDILAEGRQKAKDTEVLGTDNVTRTSCSRYIFLFSKSNFLHPLHMILKRIMLLISSPSALQTGWQHSIRIIEQLTQRIYYAKDCESAFYAWNGLR